MAQDWTVQQVCEWVGSLEGPLRDYGDAFERHAIDGKALLALNDSWLEKLGMESVGHRINMLAAIELLKAPAGNISSTSTSASGVTSSTASSASGSSEHEVDGVQEQIEQLVVDDSEEQELDEMYQRLKKAREDGLSLPLEGKRGQALGGPKRLLAIEVFAGSHPVGCHFQHLRQQAQQQQQQQQQPTHCSLAAYTAIEAQGGQQFRAPEPESLGLAPDHHLDLQGQVQDPDIRAQLLEFVRRELDSFTVQHVVVFGGPPCTMYSTANKPRQQREQALRNAKAAVGTAGRELHDLLQTLALAGPVAVDDIAQARQVLHSAESILGACEAAAGAVKQDEQSVREADAVVASFLALFKAIQRECQAACNTPCHLVMENPYSRSDWALWNRPFMKEDHLLNLPDAPAATGVALRDGFQPSSSAWLNTVWQNWCTYGPEYSQKDTIIFSTLTTEAFPDRRCAAHCKDTNRGNPGGHVHKVQVQQGAFERKWPREFVDAVLRACVGEEPYAGL